MEGEINNYIKVWFIVILSLCYSYTIGKFVPKGIPRLLAIIPIVYLFLLLPLNLHSMHLGGMFAFFIAWLGNFKLLLFALGKGPLSDPSITFKRFIAVASLPIKIQQNYPSSKLHTNGQNKSNPLENGQIKQNPEAKKSEKGHKSFGNYAIKVLLLAILIKVYDYSCYMHPKLVLILYCIHIYFCLELILAMVATMARAIFGFELESQFNDPHLSTSLQDFWGRRWNIMVSSILRPTVYEPFRHLTAPLIGREWAALPAVFCTFLVSGLMHELIFYYLGRVKPTWEITWFFILHGVCLTIEIGLKKTGTGKFRLHRLLSGPLTLGFLISTAFWLFFPQLLRCNFDERAFEEYAEIGAFVKDFTRALTSKTFDASRGLSLLYNK
ncbi:acyl-CoA--sterol O-acyltransferase 1-like [Quillaja saponaria]|uniref:Acyl-CoA--sterol O-acyltransferase 1-like n=1 Tax=Quillaja saponaria TaxID=32244 RepID=A0AAD7KVH8_QUISA|nr:acyl-CoA--sterol O-acyltransferase 1-like [Quillaja saponaria]